MPQRGIKGEWIEMEKDNMVENAAKEIIKEEASSLLKKNRVFQFLVACAVVLVGWPLIFGAFSGGGILIFFIGLICLFIGGSLAWKACEG